MVSTQALKDLFELVKKLGNLDMLETVIEVREELGTQEGQVLHYDIMPLQNREIGRSTASPG